MDLIWLVLAEARGAPVAASVLAVAALAFLPAPDVDLWAIRVLHHRSAVTHSVGWPFLVLWAAPYLGLSPVHGAAAASGAAMGVAVHLAADLLSPLKGFGRVWWPEPFQRSLGRWSALWLMLHALGAAWAGAALAPAGLGGVAAVVGVGAAGFYGLLRERRLLSALVAGAVVLAPWGVVRLVAG